MKTTRLLIGARLVALLAAAALIAVASVDVFSTHSFFASAWALKLQGLICVVLFIELVLEFFLSQHKGRFFLTHLPLLLLCVPYGIILDVLNISLPGAWAFVLQIIPVLRAVFLLAQLLGALRFGSIVSMSGAYLALLSAILYFSSLIFYIAEYGINPDVHSYRTALYWAVMSMTTTGSNVQEITMVGQVIAAVLSATGLILFPVFTVYIASFVARAGKRDADAKAKAQAQADAQAQTKADHS